MSSDPAPQFPPIFGTGFVVHESGIVATNRHVIEAFRQVPRHPTTGESALAAVMFIPDTRANEKGQRILVVNVRDYVVLSTFSSNAEWYGNELPDLGFVRLNIQNVPALTGYGGLLRSTRHGRRHSRLSARRPSNDDVRKQDQSVDAVASARRR